MTDGKKKKKNASGNDQHDIDSARLLSLYVPRGAVGPTVVLRLDNK